MSEAPPTQRLDRWLWMARLFRSRTRAAAFVAGGHIRVNSVRVAKAHHPVRVADVLTFAAGSRVRVIRVLGHPARRGPAAEARALYEDLSPAPPPGGTPPWPAGRRAPAARPKPSAGRWSACGRPGRRRARAGPAPPAARRQEASRVAARGFDGCWCAVCKDPRLDRLRLHDLRHTAVSQAVMAGENLPLGR